MTGSAWAAAKFASSTHAAPTCDALKDFDNAGWVADLPAPIRSAWIERIRSMRLADRVAESTALHVVGAEEDGLARAFDGASAAVRAAWKRYRAALRAYHRGHLRVWTLAAHRRMLDRLSGSLLQLVPFLEPHHFEAIRAFGVLDQFFNNLRDLAEDAAQGICYFPEDVLARAGLRREDVLGDGWRTLDAPAPARPPRLATQAKPAPPSGWRKLMRYWLDEYLPGLERDAARFDACDDLHPSVLRSSRLCVIRLNWFCLPFANGVKPSGRDSKRLEISARGLSSPLRQIEIVSIGADTVRVPNDQNIRIGILLQTVGKLL